MRLLLLVVYFVIGVVVAASHHYFEYLGFGESRSHRRFWPWVFWPLVLFGVSLHLK